MGYKHTIDFALCLGSNLCESALGQVDGVFFAGGAIIGNGNDDRLVVLRVDDLDLLAAKRGFLAGITILSLVNLLVCQRYTAFASEEFEVLRRL